MITSLIRYVNTYCHATSYLFTTSQHIVIGCFRFTSSLCLCLQPCDKRLLLLRLTGTEPKEFVGKGILLLLAQFDILLIFVPLVRLFHFRIVLLFIFFVSDSSLSLSSLSTESEVEEFTSPSSSSSSSLPLRWSSSAYNSIHYCSASACFKSRFWLTSSMASCINFSRISLLASAYVDVALTCWNIKVR